MGDGDAKIVLLAGASGLTGARTLDALLEAPDVARVLAVSRRPLGREHPRSPTASCSSRTLEAQLKGIELRRRAVLPRHHPIARPARRRTSAPSTSGCVLAFARAAKAANARRFVVISSVGANPDSRNFYLRTKGEMEQAARGRRLRVPGHPAALAAAGMRARRCGRWSCSRCSLMPLMNPLLGGKYQAYRGISARTVGTGHARGDALGAPRRAALHLARHPGARAPDRGAHAAAAAARRRPAPAEPRGSQDAGLNMRTRAALILALLLLVSACSTWRPRAGAGTSPCPAAPRTGATRAPRLPRPRRAHRHAVRVRRRGPGRL